MPTTLNWGKRHFTARANIQYLQNLFLCCVKSLFRSRPVCSSYQPNSIVLTSGLYLMLIYYLWHSRYSYAIVGINLTEMAYSLLRTGALKPHFYNTVQGTPELKHFHQLYCEYLISIIFYVTSDSFSLLEKEILLNKKRWISKKEIVILSFQVIWRMNLTNSGWLKNQRASCISISTEKSSITSSRLI